MAGPEHHARGIEADKRRMAYQGLVFAQETIQISMNKLSAIEPGSEHEPVRAGSDRFFGTVFAAVFLVIGLWPLLDGRSPRYWALFLACAIALAVAFAPTSLRPLNVLWTRFGAVLHQIVTPIVMGVVFFLTVVPTGLVLRLLKKDPLRLKRDINAETYWIERSPTEIDPQTMTRQF